MRNLTFELSPPILYELGIEQSIEWLVDRFRDKHEIQLEFSADGKAKPLDDDIRVILFQAVRELLMNVVKHSKATEAKISVRRKAEEILVRIDDNGVGFESTTLPLFSTKKGGFGLFNIRERMKDFDGHLDIQSKVGQGTQITLKAPYKFPEKT
jgi:signal transduction histidine kinase